MEGLSTSEIQEVEVQMTKNFRNKIKFDVIELDGEDRGKKKEKYDDEIGIFH